MTTEKLIELAKICGNDCSCTPDCPYYDTGDVGDCMPKLLTDVTERLEKAYIDLKEHGYCGSCKYSNICPGDSDAVTDCIISDKWKWEGDDE